MRGTLQGRPDPRVVGVFGVVDLACDLGTVARVTMRRPWVAMASFVVVLLVLALGHRWSVTASWFTSDKTCGERHATPWFVERLESPSMPPLVTTSSKSSKNVTAGDQPSSPAKSPSTNGTS
jgi:hypothetical protein